MQRPEIKIAYPSNHAAAAIEAIKEMNATNNFFFKHELDDKEQVLIIKADTVEDFYKLGQFAYKYLKP